MDPKQTLKEMQECHRKGYFEGAALRARYLKEWVSTGGWLPVPYSRTTFILYLDCVILRAEKLRARDASFGQNKEAHAYLERTDTCSRSA